MQTTVQGDKVEVTGEGDNLKVNDDLIWRPDGQRDRLPHRLGAHAPDVSPPGPPERRAGPAVVPAHQATAVVRPPVFGACWAAARLGTTQP